MEDDWEAQMEQDVEQIDINKDGQFDGENFTVKNNNNQATTVTQQQKPKPVQKKEEVDESTLEDKFASLSEDKKQKMIKGQNPLQNEGHYVGLAGTVVSQIQDAKPKQLTSFVLELLKNSNHVLTSKEYQDIFDKLKPMINEQKLEERGKGKKGGKGASKQQQMLQRMPVQQQTAEVKKVEVKKVEEKKVEEKKEEVVNNYQKNDDDDFDFM